MFKKTHRFLKRKFARMGIEGGVMALCALLLLSGVVFKYGEYSQSLQCLTHLIYAEARGMDEQAQYDVAHSVMNRVEANRPYFGGNTVCGVVYYTQNGVRQYSGVSRDFSMPEDMESWKRSMAVARDVLTGKVEPVGAMRDALYYLNPKYSNSRSIVWFRTNLREIGTSGAHIFYTDK